AHLLAGGGDGRGEGGIEILRGIATDRTGGEPLCVNDGDHEAIVVRERRVHPEVLALQRRGERVDLARRVLEPLEEVARRDAEVNLDLPLRLLVASRAVPPVVERGADIEDATPSACAGGAIERPPDVEGQRRRRGKNGREQQKGAYKSLPGSMHD